jgi:hypothetical protein
MQAHPYAVALIAISNDVGRDFGTENSGPQFPKLTHLIDPKLSRRMNQRQQAQIFHLTAFSQESTDARFSCILVAIRLLYTSLQEN